MTKLVEKNDKVKSFSTLLVENQLIPVPIRFLNQLRKAQVLQNSLRKVYLSILLSNWNCYLWESITAYNYGFAQDLPEKGKPCAKPLTVSRQFLANEKQQIKNLILTQKHKKMNESKFYDVQTTTGQKTVNINNIALIEDVKNGTKITTNIKDINGHNISFITLLPWSTISSEITQKDLNQNF